MTSSPPFRMMVIRMGSSSSYELMRRRTRSMVSTSRSPTARMTSPGMRPSRVVIHVDDENAALGAEVLAQPRVELAELDARGKASAAIGLQRGPLASRWAPPPLLFARSKEEHIRLALKLEHPFQQPPLLEADLLFALDFSCTDGASQARRDARERSSSASGAQRCIPAETLAWGAITRCSR